MNIQVYTLPEALNGLGSTSQPRTSIDLNFNCQSAFRHIFSGSLPTYRFCPSFARGFLNFLYTSRRALHPAQPTAATASPRSENPTFRSRLDVSIPLYNQQQLRHTTADAHPNGRRTRKEPLKAAFLTPFSRLPTLPYSAYQMPPLGIEPRTY